MGNSVAELLGAAGPFCQRFEGFTPRTGQQEMAEAIHSAVTEKRIGVYEAGTGTGKTLSYLVPAFIFDKRTIISTATKALQDQLFLKDIPQVMNSLGTRRKVALLKGRQNYICLYRLRRTIGSPNTDHRDLPKLDYINRWAQTSIDGDLERVEKLEELGTLRSFVTSTRDNCLGQNCENYEECFVVKARRESSNADLIIVNHHLLFADMVLKETGFAELLPNADAIILDEAHKAPEAAAQFFSRSISLQQLRACCKELHESQLEAVGMDVALRDLEGAIDDFFQNASAAVGKNEWNVSAQEGSNILASMTKVALSFEKIVQIVSELARSPQSLEQMCDRLESMQLVWSLFLTRSPEGHVHWIETTDRNVTFYDTPLQIGNDLQDKIRESGCAWIFTSATLAVENDFTYFTDQMGIPEAETQRWDSPFDFRNNSLLYVPNISSEPRSKTYDEDFVTAILPVLSASNGRAFILFTSYRAMRAVGAILGSFSDYPLFVQGDGSKSELVERFKTTSKAVLLGTASFWEGIDVRGDQLSCVIIDKLPFAVPDDPVLAARSRQISSAGRNAFIDFQVPQAVNALKQGAGRLIRDASDRGVLVIGDTRILTKSYGRFFLKSLPPMPLTRELEDVERFFFHSRS